MGRERGAPLVVVLEEGSGVVGASDVNRSSDGGGSAELRHDSNVGAAGGVAETCESRASKWSRGIKSRADAADSRLRKGREWISDVMSSRVAGDRVARSEVLREGREKLIAFQRSKEEARKSAEEARKSRAGDWMSAHVKFDREWSPPWEE